MSDWRCDLHGVRNCTICIRPRVVPVIGRASCNCSFHRKPVVTRERIRPITTRTA